MRTYRFAGLLLPLIAAIQAVSAAAAGPAREGVLYEAVMVRADVSGQLPADMVRPEGRTRWDFTNLRPAGSWGRRVQEDPGSRGLVVVQAAPGMDRSNTEYVDNSGDAADVARWLLPHRYADELADTKPRTFRLTERRGKEEDRLWMEIRRVGVGWLHLPSGKHEVILQRVEIQREAWGERGNQPTQLIYRWVDPRQGVVAEVWGPDSGGGLAKLQVQGASYLDRVKSGDAPLKIYADQIDLPVFTRLAYGFQHQGRCNASGALCGLRDGACGTGDSCGLIRISDLTTPGYTTAGDLINNVSSAWDFSVNTLSRASWQVGSISTAVANTETCNYANFFTGTASWQCQINPSGPGMAILREDRGFDDSTMWVCGNTTTPCGVGGDCTGIGDGYCVHHSAISVTQGEPRGSDYTVWSRGGTVKEGKAGALGAGESFYCHGRQAGDPNGRPQVALYRFRNPDAGRYYMKVGDPVWGTAASGDQIFTCDQDFNANRCPDSGCGFGCQSWAYTCTTGGSPYSGTQSGQVVKEGSVTLPSGHTFQSLVIRTKAELCTSGFSSCILPTPVRTVIYLWVTPYLGTLVRLQSVTNAADETSFTVLDESDVKYGLFPPLSITVTGATSNSVTLSWNPGIPAGGPNRLKGFNVYWGTQSGVYGPPQFVSGGDTTGTTISGLTPGTQYFFTVTSLSDFRDPASQVTKTYESLKYPTTVPTSTGALPVEVQATPDCTGYVPLQEVSPTGLGVTKSESDVQVCWTPAAEACLTGYRIIGSDNNTSDAGWSTLADAPTSATCKTLTPANQKKNYLVIAIGSGGTGPWGHYGH